MIIIWKLIKEMQYTELICSATSSLYNATGPLLNCINIVLKKWLFLIKLHIAGKQNTEYTVSSNLCIYSVRKRLWPLVVYLWSIKTLFK